MKKLIFVSILIVSTIFCNAQSMKIGEGDKAAIVLASFGTTFDDTRALTIDAIRVKVKEAFPQFEVREAYTSRIVIRNLGKKGIIKHTPREVLLQLAAEGYTHVILQGTFIIPGIESDNLINEAEMMAPFFKEIRVGLPLMSSADDCSKAVEILAERNKNLTGKSKEIVFVGHGTSSPVNAIYSQLDHIFAATGHQDMHVSTIEGYPTFDTVVARLKSRKVKKVTLIPLMFVTGDHARNDIEGEWCELLRDAGFKADAVIEGLGQIPGIQDIYIEHIKAAIENRPKSSVEIKTDFIRRFS